MISNLENNNQIVEYWKSIKGFDGYEVSNYGIVRNKKGIVLNGYKNKKGYIIVCLNSENKTITKIVAQEFLPNVDKKKYIKHKDGNFSNNNVSNLEWTNDCFKYKKSELDRKLAVDDYFNKGMSCQEISIKYNVNRKTIGNWIKGFNKKARKNSGWRDFDKINNLVNDYVNGARTSELSKKYNVSNRTVAKWIKEKGVSPIFYPEKMGYTEELKQKIVSLYKSNLTCNDIAILLKLKIHFVYQVIKKYFRKNGDYNGIRIMGGRGKYYGSKGGIETRFGFIRYDSLYERDRIIQNSRDFTIKSMERCKFKIKYFNSLSEHIYKPDFFIQNVDNSFVIEEVKPISMLDKHDNQFKHEFATKYCNENGYKFRVVTEKEIYAKN
jgi:transposase